MNLDNLFKQEQELLQFYNSHPRYRSSMSRGSSVKIGRMLTTSNIILNSNSRVLDIGCGDGRVSQLIASQYGCNVIGVDYSEARIERGKQFIDNSLVTLIVANAYDFIDHYNKQAELIMLFDVLEHLVAPKLLLDKCKEKSKAIIGSAPVNWRYCTHIQLFESVEAVEKLGVSTLFISKGVVYFNWM